MYLRWVAFFGILAVALWWFKVPALFWQASLGLAVLLVLVFLWTKFVGPGDP